MIPSIFNDVIGPVMRGPSSSHCAAANRIALLCRELMDGAIDSAVVQFDRNGSLATTHESQGSDLGLFGGLLGMACTDERFPDAPKLMKDAGIDVRVEIDEYGMTHPNTYRLILANAGESHVVEAISTGGGMIEIVRIDGVTLSIRGDAYEALLFFPTQAVEDVLRAYPELCAEALAADKTRLLKIRSAAPIEEAVIADLSARGGTVRRLSPVLPALSPPGMSVPFSTCEEMLRVGNGLSLSELAREYEAARTGKSKDDVSDTMRGLVGILRESLRRGLEGTEYGDRILHSQSPGFKARLDSGALLDGGAVNLITLYVSALMEVKSAMGIIVAAPTAGACAALPAACIGTADAMGMSAEDVTRGMLAAGMIGIFIATRGTFAAEVAGCQAECGAASGMTAAALVEMMGGSAEQAVAAASMALQNSFGMVCDPVANRVEVPCLGKNVMAAANAFCCANMALAGYDPVVPLDETIAAMDEVGRNLDRRYRCTALGGLSITPTSRKIVERLRDAADGTRNHG